MVLEVSGLIIYFLKNALKVHTQKLVWLFIKCTTVWLMAVNASEQLIVTWEVSVLGYLSRPVFSPSQIIVASPKLLSEVELCEGRPKSPWIISVNKMQPLKQRMQDNWCHLWGEAEPDNFKQWHHYGLSHLEWRANMPPHDDLLPCGVPGGGHRDAPLPHPTNFLGNKTNIFKCGLFHCIHSETPY